MTFLLLLGEIMVLLRVDLLFLVKVDSEVSKKVALSNLRISRMILVASLLIVIIVDSFILNFFLTFYFTTLFPILFSTAGKKKLPATREKWNDDEQKRWIITRSLEMFVSWWLRNDNTNTSSQNMWDTEHNHRIWRKE